MAWLLPTFQAVSIIFAISAVITGMQALVNPVGFSKSFGLASDSKSKHSDSLSKSYISLMGVRQLSTGIILLTFALQNKRTEMATILAIIGVLVAGTDGIFLALGATKSAGLFHAVPGAAIAALAGTVLYSHAASRTA